jgi:hypothetical protein
MNTDSFIREQFVTLREEIKAINARLFWIVVMGLFGVPALTYLALGVREYVVLLVPYSTLVVIVLFLAEQNKMMRAGRFVREHIEPVVGDAPKWEAWLESRTELRLMERHFAACFIVIFFIYYAVTISIAVQRLLRDAAADPSGQNLYWLAGAGITYALGAAWAVSTLVHHWKASVGTTADGNGGNAALKERKSPLNSATLNEPSAPA